MLHRLQTAELQHAIIVHKHLPSELRRPSPKSISKPVNPRFMTRHRIAQKSIILSCLTSQPSGRSSPHFKNANLESWSESGKWRKKQLQLYKNFNIVVHSHYPVTDFFKPHQALQQKPLTRFIVNLTLRTEITPQKWALYWHGHKSNLQQMQNI